MLDLLVPLTFLVPNIPHISILYVIVNFRINFLIPVKESKCSVLKRILKISAITKKPCRKKCRRPGSRSQLDQISEGEFRKTRKITEPWSRKEKKEMIAHFVSRLLRLLFPTFSQLEKTCCYVPPGGRSTSFSVSFLSPENRVFRLCSISRRYEEKAATYSQLAGSICLWSFLLTQKSRV